MIVFKSRTGTDRTIGQRENLRWRKDLTQWRQTNDKQDKYVFSFPFFFVVVLMSGCLALCLTKRFSVAAFSGEVTTSIL